MGRIVKNVGQLRPVKNVRTSLKMSMENVCFHVPKVKEPGSLLAIAQMDV